MVNFAKVQVAGQTVVVSQRWLQKFKEAYNEVKVKPMIEVFHFYGNTYSVNYAKYLIEYLDNHFKEPH